MAAVHGLAYLVDSCIVNALLVEGAIDPGRDLHNVHEEGGLCVCLFVCLLSFIYIPLHGARRAMAAAGFSRITFSYPEPACAGGPAV